MSRLQQKLWPQNFLEMLRLVKKSITNEYTFFRYSLYSLYNTSVVPMGRIMYKSIVTNGKLNKKNLLGRPKIFSSFYNSLLTVYTLLLKVTTDLYMIWHMHTIPRLDLIVKEELRKDAKLLFQKLVTKVDRGVHDTCAMSPY